MGNNFTNCYLGLGMMALNGVGAKKDVELAIKFLTEAVDGEHFEAASILAHIYLTEPEFMNKSLGYKNLDYASREPTNMNAKLMLVSYYYENSLLLATPYICNKVMQLIADLQFINEVDLWYALGHKIFNFAAFEQSNQKSNKILCKK